MPMKVYEFQGIGRGPIWFKDHAIPILERSDNLKRWAEGIHAVTTIHIWGAVDSFEILEVWPIQDGVAYIVSEISEQTTFLALACVEDQKFIKELENLADKAVHLVDEAEKYSGDVGVEGDEESLKWLYVETIRDFFKKLF